MLTNENILKARIYKMLGALGDDVIINYLIDSISQDSTIIDGISFLSKKKKSKVKKALKQSIENLDQVGKSVILFTSSIKG